MMLMHRVLGMDRRSMAALRILLAAILLWDVTSRLADLTAFYTDEGMFPRDFSQSVLQGDGAVGWSLSFLSGEAPFQGLLFLLAIVASAAMLVGYRTRPATVAVWILLTSIHMRALWINNGGDMLLRFLLTWGMFLPWGSAWSIDAWRSSGPPPRKSSLSFATAAVLFQIAVMYFVSGLLKWNPAWLGSDGWGGDALYIALSQDFFARPAAQALREHTGLVRMLGLATLGLEIAVPVAVFSPWRTGTIRLIAVVLFAGFHLSIELFMPVGIFSAVCIAAWSAFLPGSFWDFLARRLSRRPAGPEPEKGAPLKVSAWPELAAQAACGILLAYLVVWIVLDLANARQQMPAPLTEINRVMIIHQRWSMFEHPTAADNWYVADAQLNDGRRVNLLSGEPLADPEAQTGPQAVFPNFRWLYLFHILSGEPEPFRSQQFGPHVADYLRRRWNANHGEEQHVAAVWLRLYWKPIDPDGEATGYSSETIGYVGLAGDEPSSLFEQVYREQIEDNE